MVIRLKQVSTNWARRRWVYAVAAVAVILLGLMSRRGGALLPAIAARYAGDTLWALLVFLLLGLFWPKASTLRLAGAALAVSYAVEVSQLYHAPWLDAVRHTTLGGLILGFGFVWSDLACYTAGVLAGVLLERLLLSARP